MQFYFSVATKTNFNVICGECVKNKNQNCISKNTIKQLRIEIGKLKKQIDSLKNENELMKTLYETQKSQKTTASSLQVNGTSVPGKKSSKINFFEN